MRSCRYTPFVATALVLGGSAFAFSTTWGQTNTQALPDKIIMNAVPSYQDSLLVGPFLQDVATLSNDLDDLFLCQVLGASCTVDGMIYAVTEERTHWPPRLFSGCVQSLAGA
jgi:hypothetical protein